MHRFVGRTPWWRPVAFAVLVTAVTIAAAPAAPTASTFDPVRHEAVTAAKSVARADLPALRPFDLVPALAAGFVILAGLTVGWRLAGSLIRRHRRCLWDVGDDWRALLRGAPPAAG